MTPHEALTFVIDAARQQASLNRNSRNEGLADLQDAACAVCALSFGLQLAVVREFGRDSVEVNSRPTRISGGAR
jgi:hypothetical protein